MLGRLVQLAMRRPPLQMSSRAFPTFQRFSTLRSTTLPPPLRSEAHAALRPQSLAPVRPLHRTFASGRQTYRGFGGTRASNVRQLWLTSRTFQRSVYAVGGGGALAIALNIEQVPGSGRWRFNFVSPELEARLSSSQYTQLQQQFAGHLLPPDSAEVRRVRRVLERLQPHSGLANAHAKWTVDVIADKTPNAFVIPGGHVFVFSGLLPICQDDDGLATVLGHEIAHTTAHHAAEQISRAAGVWLLALLGSLVFDVDASGLLDVAVNKPGSRAQEREADRLGLLMMARACYDPEQALHFWERMQAADKHGQPPALLNTHPSHGSRVKAIQTWMPEALDARDQGACGPTAGYARDFGRFAG